MSEFLPGFGRHVQQERESARAVELSQRVLDAELREQRSPGKTAHARIWQANGEGTLRGESRPRDRADEPARTPRTRGRSR